MNIEALKTIRVHNWKWSRAKAMEFAQKYIDLISAKYPVGLDVSNETYFVIPGFEHVTNNQPVVAYSTGGEWELSTADLFTQPQEEK